MSEQKNESRQVGGTVAASGRSNNRRASAEDDNPRDTCRPATKAETILRLFAAGASLNRFEAERHGDHVLPSTVSEIQSRYRLEIERKTEIVRGRNGTPTTCARYWLAPHHRAKAAEIAEAMRLKREG